MELKTETSAYLRNAQLATVRMHACNDIHMRHASIWVLRRACMHAWSDAYAPKTQKSTCKLLYVSDLVDGLVQLTLRMLYDLVRYLAKEIINMTRRMGEE